eukprot:scaffold67896_cov60-Phaeocystis_antarctica.AAC.2
MVAPASKVYQRPDRSSRRGGSHDAAGPSASSSVARRMEAGLKSVPSGLARASWPAACSRPPTPSLKHEPSNRSGSSWRRSGACESGRIDTSVRKVCVWTTIATARRSQTAACRARVGVFGKGETGTEHKTRRRAVWAKLEATASCGECRPGERCRRAASA